MGKKQHIGARLRPGKDDDIKKAIDSLPVYYDESDIVREALRQFLFSHEGRQPLILGSQIFKLENKSVTITKDEMEMNSTVEIIEEDDLDAKLDDFLK